MKKILLGCALFVAGCTNTGSVNQSLVQADFPKNPSYQERVTAYSPSASDKTLMANAEKAIDAYFACNKISVRRAALEIGDIHILAITAEAMCLKQRHAVGSAMAAGMGEARAAQKLDELRAEMTRMDAILISRLQASLSDKLPPKPTSQPKAKRYSI